MIDRLLELCGSPAALAWLMIGADLAIAAAYLAIPVTMAIVLRHRRHDIPYPWLWLLFVAFIIACALTHLGHAFNALVGGNNITAHVALGVICAAISVGTAIAFGYVVPEIKNLPSPRQQAAELEKMVAQRTQEKDRLIREINHQIGNQLQIMSSLVSIETRQAESDETLAALARLRQTIDELSEKHYEARAADYLKQSVDIMRTS